MFPQVKPAFSHGYVLPAREGRGPGTKARNQVLKSRRHDSIRILPTLLRDLRPGSSGVAVGTVDLSEVADVDRMLELLRG